MNGTDSTPRRGGKTHRGVQSSEIVMSPRRLESLSSMSLKNLLFGTNQWGNAFPDYGNGVVSPDALPSSSSVRTRNNTPEEFWRDFDRYPDKTTQDGSDITETNRASDSDHGNNRAAAMCCKTTTLEDIWRFYALESSCHGLKNVTNTLRPKGMRFIWLVGVFAMLITLSSSVVSLLREYQHHKTVTRSDVRVQVKPYFPSVTLCNMCPYKNINRTTTNPLYILSAQNTIIRKYFPINSSDPAMREFMKVPIPNIVNTYSYTKKDMFHYATYEGKYLDIDKHFETTDTLTARCYTFNGPEYIARHGVRRVNYDGRKSGLKVVINIQQSLYLPYDGLNAGVRMFVSHHPDTPRYDKDGLDIHPGSSTRVALTPTQFQFLPFPFSSYGSEYCLDIQTTDRLRAKMHDAPFYSRNQCILQCQSVKASQICSCNTRFLRLANLPPCTVGQDLYCVQVRLKEMKAGNLNVSCDCPRRCSFTRYTSVLSSSQLPARIALEHVNKIVNASSEADTRDNFLEVQVFLDNMMIRMESHEPKYTYGSILGFLGGQMGLFMGASLLTITEVMEAIFYTLWWLGQKLHNLGKMDEPNTNKK